MRARGWALCVVLAASPAAAGLRPIVLFEPDGGPGPGGNFYGYGQPGLAAFDGGFFFSWTDERHGSLPKLYGARVTSAGVVLDDGGFPISTGGLVHKGNDVACSDSSCLVVWAAESSQHYVNVQAFDIIARGYRFDGTTIGADVVIAGGPQTRGEPAVAVGPLAVFVIVWVENGNILTTSLFNSVVGPIFTLDSTTTSGEPAVAASSTGFLATWRTGGNIRARRLSPTGLPLGVAFTVGAGERPEAAGGNDTFAVTWFTSAGGMDTLLAARVDDAGTVLDPGGLMIATQSGINGEPDPVIAWDGAEFQIVWETASTRLARQALSYSTGLSGGIVNLSPGVGGGPAIAFSGGSGAVAFLEGPVRVLGLAPGGVETFAARDVARNGSSQLHARASFDGTQLAIVWDGVSNVDSSWLKRFDPGLQPLADAVRLGTNSSGRGATSIAFDGQRQWIAWYEFTTRDRIFVRSLTGVTLGPATMVSGAGSLDTDRDVAIAGGDGVALVAWPFNTGTAQRIAGMRIVDGGLADPPDTALVPMFGDQDSPAVAYGSGQFLVAWLEFNTRTLRFARVAADTGVVTVGDSLTLPGYPARPCVASDGHDFVLVWQQNNGSPEVHLRRIRSDGGMDSSSTLVSTTRVRPVEFPESTAVAFDGHDYLVAWEMFTDAGVDLWLRRFSAESTLGPVLRLDEAPFDKQGVGLTALTPGRVLATWQHFEPAANERRIFGRLITDVPAGSSCLESSECSDSMCIVGICVAADGGSAGGAGGGDSGGSGASGGTGGSGGSGGASGGALLAGGSGGSGGNSGGGGGSGGSADTGRLTVQCGCGQAPAEAMLLLALLSARASRRAGRRSAPPGAAARE